MIWLCKTHVTWFVLIFLQIFCFLGTDGVSFEEDISITYSQKQSIDKLRRRVLPYIVEDYMKHDMYLVKWLRSTNFDLPRAEKKLIENIRWRKENKIAGIDKEDFSDIAAEYPYIEGGFDKEGRPLFIAFAGDWDLRAAVVTGRVPRVLRYLDKGLEMLSRKVRSLQQSGKNVTQANLIIELNQFSLVTHGCVQCLIRIVEFLNSYESHFPGMAHRVFFLDAPPAVHFVIDLIKQNVSKETRDAINTFGTNREQWRRVLLQQIDKKFLPEELGGTLVVEKSS